MKKSKILLTLAVGSTLALTMVGAAACNPLTDIRLFGSQNTATDSVVKTILNFVAVDGSTWDKTVSMDNKSYTLSFDLKSDNSVVLTGTCTGVSSGNQGGGNQGGPGGPGGSEAAPAAEVAPAAEPEETVDLTKYNFEVKGTWTEEKGWGYTMTIGSDTIYVNYDVTSGRHYFYYSVKATVDGKDVSASETKFEAKDGSYKKSLADNYVIHEERISTYVFNGGVQSGSNLSSTWIYLMNDGKAASVSGTSNSLTYTSGGSWSEDASKHIITVNIGGKTYESNGYCDIAGREGYRMSYSGTPLYAPKDKSFDWGSYTTEDFEGKVIYTWSGLGAFANYSMTMTTKGYVSVLENGTAAYTNYYSEDNGVFTVGDYTSTTEGGVTTIHIKWVVVTSNCCGTTETPYEGDFQLNK